ncbi:MAG: hypothetical protein JWO60_2884 [Frankiales bacterium]|nr:hypothetical protein [Frankiales bacterium]
MSAPPLPTLLAYRLLGWRLGPEHQAWTHADITGRWYLVKQGLPLLVALGALLAVVFAATGSDPQRVVAPMLAVLVLLVFLRNTVVERALRQQGLTLDGEVDTAATSWFADDEARRKRSLSGAVATVLLVLVGLLVIGLGPTG